jgi:hypothetical protein
VIFDLVLRALDHAFSFFSPIVLSHFGSGLGPVRGLLLVRSVFLFARFAARVFIDRFGFPLCLAQLDNVRLPWTLSGF